MCPRNLCRPTRLSPEQLSERTPRFDYEITKVALKAGDLVVMASTDAARKRKQHVFTMNPADQGNGAEDRAVGQKSQAQCVVGAGGSEEKREGPEELTALGSKAVGVG